jgi:flagellar hook assembly protein FlgD
VTIDLAAAARVDLGIFDVRGRLIQPLLSGTRAAGPHAVRWGGSDASGHPVPPGVYFARLAHDGVVANAKILRVE